MLCIIYVTFPKHKTILSKNAKINVYFKKCLSSLLSFNSPLILQAEELSRERAVFAGRNQGELQSGSAEAGSRPLELSLRLSGSRNIWGSEQRGGRPFIQDSLSHPELPGAGCSGPCGPSETDWLPAGGRGTRDPFLKP